MNDDLSRAQWRKSSYSGNTGNCVQVAVTESVVGIRDSKDPDGPDLVVTHQEWRGLVQTIKTGEISFG
jgi:Domain of unknown function (DUF397)